MNTILSELTEILGHKLTAYILGVDSTLTMHVITQIDGGIRGVNYGGTRYAWFAVKYFQMLGETDESIQSTFVCRNDLLGDHSPAALFASRKTIDWERALTGCIQIAATA